MRTDDNLQDDNMNQDELSGSLAPCPECSAGVMRLKHITYFTWLNGELVTVPNFPAWICDVCGRREFDPRAITWLNTLLNTSAGGKSRAKLQRKSRPAGTDRLRP
ncbi:MAG: YgiT-type zinc finger protein [Anaerolineales bacterium]|jgi:YgiT-type zinc finger domain-containing protein